jgi:hypothetical protein
VEPTGKPAGSDASDTLGLLNGTLAGADMTDVNNKLRG